MYNETQKSTAEARRLKKRELDRKAQRLARERTKSRIAQLESMVDNLRQDHSNAQIATLMDLLGKVTKERDNLLQGRTSIRYEIRSITTRKPCKIYTRRADSPNHYPKVNIRSKQLNSTRALHNPPPLPDPFTYDGWNYTVSNEPYPTTMAFNNSILPPTGNGFNPIQPLLPDIHAPPEVVDVIIPKASVLCPCSSPTSRGANFHDQ
ncbi:hypothetical protein FOYG_17285 [Fusarium oxysporum NRRL 32931]|uniref:BZIP domain-containing protein n=1 Tax=Fusarium oxysporum NRRL 32931 TaxID=660029 RepID=W9HBC5_FUSOX|nr:hypothetical protein FOYG_17285 [Fusarium oxysporum NRRL 32931]